MKIRYVFLISIIILINLFSCEKEIEKIPGIDISKMDKSVNPKNDFFKYVNGNWLKNTEIPSDRTSWGSFNELRKETDSVVLEIINRVINNENADLLIDTENKFPETSSQQKSIYLYQSFSNFENRNKLGIKPLKPYLNDIEKLKDLEGIQNYTTEMQSLGGRGNFYHIYIASHPKNSNINAVFLNPSRLGLRRSYYVDKDNDTKEKINKYKAYISRMLQFLGDDKEISIKNAEEILTIETALATPRMSKEERRDARKRFNPMTIAGITKLAPQINWEAYFNGLGIKKIDTVIVTDPNYFKALGSILKTAKISKWKNYLRWTAINQNTGSLTADIDVASWEFYNKTLQGSKEQKPLEERALSTMNKSIGEAIGRLYIDNKFPPEAKVKAKKMIKNIRTAFGNRIKKLNWMSEETKEKALVKLSKMTVKIAYPDNWKDYSALNIQKENSLFENRLQLAKWKFDKNLNKIGKNVDKTEWHMNPQTVNAYFNPSNNEIVFPAAILQPPFYNHKADDAVNYGGIGAVIGHEISHSFDDSGSRYDGDGNLVDWWTKEDLEKFTVLGKKLENQFNEIEALPSIYLNGKYTLGENIGDLGGVNVAYDALQLHYKEKGKQKEIDGFTAEQRFFMSWATIWRTKMRDEALKNLIKTNPHAPALYRAYMPLRNIESFYTAFDIKEGDKMYLNPEDRVLIW